MDWDWDGWMDGIGSPGGRGYRAPYGANNEAQWTKIEINGHLSVVTT